MSNKYSILFVALLLCFLPQFIQAQHYNFKIYSIEEGLAQSQVFFVNQDSHGYLWCGTYGGGISCFDGNDIVNYSRKDGLSNNVVLSMLEDRDGYLWFGTDHGVNRFDGHNFLHYTTRDGLPNDTIHSILEDNDGNLWFATDGGGICKYDGKNFRSYSTADGLINDHVLNMCKRRNGTFLIGTKRGISIFDGKSFRDFSGENGVPVDEVRHILEDRNGHLWISTAHHGVCVFDGKKSRFLTPKEGLGHLSVRYALQDRNSNYWFATDHGVSMYDGETMLNFSKKEGLPHNSIQCIYEDLEGNIWFATDFGIVKFSGRMFTYISQKDGLRNNMVWSFWEETEDDIVWLGFEGGIAIYSKKRREIIKYLDQFNGCTPFPFYEDHEGNLWFGARKCIYKYNGKQFTNITERYKLKRANVFSIYQDSKNTLYFGVENGGVFRFDGKSFSRLTTENGLLHNNVNTICEDKFGRIYFGTDGGISIFDGEHFSAFTSRQGLQGKYVMSILPDREKNLWIGTYGGGIFKIRPSRSGKINRLESFTSKDGLSDNEVLLMIFDNQGDLFVGTNKGITKLDLFQYRATGEKIFKFYGISTGFIGIECNQGAVYKDNGGNLWFGTLKGAIKYNPMEDKPNLIEPLTHVKNIKLFLEDVDWSDYSKELEPMTRLPLTLNLPYHQNHLTFEYVGVSLTAPEEVKYQVFLEGFDKGWSPYTTKTSVTYSNLPPGDYSFKVKACNNDGVWNIDPAEFKFAILAPFWQKIWFFLLCGALGIFSISFIIKYRTRSLERQQRYLKEKINEHTLALKKEKAKIEKINLELEERVRERTEKLKIANKQLVRAQKMEAIGALAGGVAHDLNNVLAGIITYPELLLGEITDEKNPIRNYLLKIKKSGEKAAAIVQDLLTLARRGTTPTSVVNINTVVMEYLNSPEFEKLRFYHPKMQVDTNLSDNLENIMGSAVHLSKTIMNLVSNAAEAMPDGGKILVRTENRYVERPVTGYETVKEGVYVVLSVSDEGVGISEEDQEKIFEPFYTKKVMGRSGTGLGMAVVWGSVKDHDGYVEVDSTQGKGTTFTLYFPKTSLKLFKDKQSPSVEDFKGSGESVLIVDDVKEQREIVSLMLSKLGYTVAAVPSGEKAVEYLRKNEVDLVILDMIMDPGMDGCDTYKTITQFKPRQRAIIASGFTETERVAEAQRSGAGAFIKKPYLMKEIAMAIKSELKK